MQQRIDAELTLIRTRYPDLQFRPDGRWVLLPRYSAPPGWNRAETAVAFQIPAQYPGTPPYGFYVPAGLTFNGQRPGNCTDTNAPPFGGDWMLFSWQPEGQWLPTADLLAGPNLLNWVLGFQHRFAQGV